VKQIPLSDIDIGDEEIKSVTNVLKSKWLTMGPVTEQFEKEFADYLGVKYSFGVSNGTAALHMANKVLGIGKGDEVIVPSLTFVATANASLYCGAKPVFADITSLDNLNISPDDVLEKITGKTKAITVVHYGGYPCDMDAIMEIAYDHNLKVIEDAAHAPGAEYNGKKCGNFGDIGCFSFFSNKNIVTGEGGMIVTSNEVLAKKIKTMRSHSMTTLTWDRHNGHAYSYDVDDIGFNYRINEIASALGLVQLSKLDYNNKKRKRIFNEYIGQLNAINEISIPFREFKWKSSFHIFPILLSEGIDKYKIIDGLKKNGIQTSVHYPPIHLFSYYKRKFRLDNFILPKTEFVADNIISLPLYPDMTKEDVIYVTQSLKKLIRRHN
jgi:dTDP-4-amino-4,6-dideoxygalactose transaminase